MCHILVVHYNYSFLLDNLDTPYNEVLRAGENRKSTESVAKPHFFSLLCFLSSISPLLYFESLLLKDNCSD